jgi:indole-3-glycerol phosphate synthase
MSQKSGRFSSAVISENKRGFAAVIPDIKCVSPKEGDLLQGRDPVETAKYLVGCGATLLSVVTEKERFGGSASLLLEIVQNTGAPVLRKDFITSEDEILKTVDLGAAAVLLICAVTDEKNLCMLYEKSLKTGLEPFVEVCTAQEMKLAVNLGAGLIGINNRNIMTLEQDDGGPSRTAALISGAPKGAVLVSESGILSPDDAKLAVSAGANAVLVGTALWQARDMAEMYRNLRVERVERVELEERGE